MNGIIVAQIFNLPYRRFVIGSVSRVPVLPTWSQRRRMQFCDTADYKSALR